MYTLQGNQSRYLVHRVNYIDSTNEYVSKRLLKAFFFNIKISWKCYVKNALMLHNQLS